VRICSLCLVDLAGSERLDKSKSEGKRLKETQNINRSLSCLGDVFMAILNKDSYVPFRNSKLTYFLQDYLSGESRVSIVLNISQEEKHYHETLCTLRFGSKVSECKLGKVTRNILKQSYKNKNI
jgi:kinesin family protein C1